MNNNKMNNTHYRIIEWQDTETDAIGWIVIDRLINGVSGGGLFMHPHATLDEVKDLASTMSLKLTLQEPMYGGAKAGIRFDHQHDNAHDVIHRFLQDNKELLETIWNTGADLNTRNDVIEKIVQEELNLPSVFISLAHMVTRSIGIASQAEKMEERISYPLNDYFSLGAGATGYSVAETMHLLKINNPRVIIQGFGNVGGSLAYYIDKEKLGKVVGICERDGYIFYEDGIDVETLLKRKKDTKTNTFKSLESLLTSDELERYNWCSRSKFETDEDLFSNLLEKQPAEVLSPCAARYTITRKVAGTFANNELEQFVISGANNVFSSQEIIPFLEDKGVQILPEWVSNSGNAILFLESLKYEKINEDWPKFVCNIIQQRIESFLINASKGKGTLYERCLSWGQKRLEQAGDMIDKTAA